MEYVNYIECLSEEHDDTDELIFGLRKKKKKRVNSKYFYDENGSILFDQITKLDEYYPTKKELEILDIQRQEIGRLLPSNSAILEFGSGSNLKIKKLLKIIDSPEEIISIDISKKFLLKNANELAHKFPEIKVTAICADLNQKIDIREIVGMKIPKIGFFPGSTIGNFVPEDAKKLLKRFNDILGSNNFLVVGVDLKKDIKILEKAYNDSEGITAEFNKNILNRINIKFGSKFKKKNFDHRAFFNSKENRIEMHLVSKKHHCVDILDNKVCLKPGESIHTENSYKYTISSFKKLCENVGFEFQKVFTDKQSFFGIFILKTRD